ncbi:MAG: glycosyl hydrolase family 65 protein [Pseudomonadota bacterium]
MRQLRTTGQILLPTEDTAWVLHEDGCDPLRDSSRETRFAISNGFLGVRGAQAINRGATWATPLCTYVAGLFDTPDTIGAIPELIPAADWLQVGISLRGSSLAHHPGDISSHPLTLDMKRGALLTEFRQFDVPALSLRLRTLRLVSQCAREVGLQIVQIEIQEGEDEITLNASLESMNLGLITERLEPDVGVWRTRHSGKTLAMAASVTLRIDDEELPTTALGHFKWSWNWKLRPGQVISLERMVTVVRSDNGASDAGSVARQKLNIAKTLGWHEVFAEHEAAWSHRWERSDVEVNGDPVAQHALRFALYHLNSAANPGDDSVSIGARALTGPDYLGHVFWDTEIFLLPFYTLTWPEAAKALLMYRFHTLDGARAKAARMGWRGALYAWESADTGVEATPENVVGPDRQVVEVLSGKQEQHISADVAYAIWQYWRATGDEDFLRDAGAEILFETARFWSSRALLEPDGRCHIRGVIGPDEYHEDIDDNAFTNVMARWNIRRALDASALMRERWPQRWEQLSSRLGLGDPELQHWLDVADTLATGLDPETGLFEQFAGFHGLEQISLASYTGRSVPMDVVLGRKRTQESQIIKQADVVALLALLPEEFVSEAGGINFKFYEPRCGHGSSLSRPMHGLVAARLGYSELASRLFQESTAIDLADTHVAIAGGIHIAALGGVWQMAIFGFGGISLLDDGIAIDPKLPARWRSLKFSLMWRGRDLQIKINQNLNSINATLKCGKPMKLVVEGEPYELRFGLSLNLATKKAAGQITGQSFGGANV